MMDEPPVESSVAILERVDVDESKGERSCRHYRVHIAFRRTFFVLDHAIEENTQILNASANMIGQWLSRPTIMSSDKTTASSEPQIYESGITNDSTLQSFELLDAQRNPARFSNDPTPPSGTNGRRTLTFDLERGLAVLEEEKRGGPADDIRVCSADDVSRFLP